MIPVLLGRFVTRMSVTDISVTKSHIVHVTEFGHAVLVTFELLQNCELLPGPCITLQIK